MENGCKRTDAGANTGDWLMRVMEIRKQPTSATPEEIVKLTDDVLMQIYFGISPEDKIGRALSVSVKNVSED